MSVGLRSSCRRAGGRRPHGRLPGGRDRCENLAMSKRPPSAVPRPRRRLALAIALILSLLAELAPASRIAFAATVRNESAKLLYSRGLESDFLGVSVSVGNGIVVVGAPWDNEFGWADSGSAFVFPEPAGG